MSTWAMIASSRMGGAEIDQFGLWVPKSHPAGPENVTRTF
jgi:hypothetical protein